VVERLVDVLKWCVQTASARLNDEESSVASEQLSVNDGSL